MEIRVATICDFAQVREGLLSVLSAGVTRVWQTQYPAPLGVMVALIFELAPGSARIPCEVRFRWRTRMEIGWLKGSARSKQIRAPDMIQERC